MVHLQCVRIGKLAIACAILTLVCLPEAEADVSEYIVRYVESVPKIVAELSKRRGVIAAVLEVCIATTPVGMRVEMNEELAANIKLPDMQHWHLPLNGIANANGHEQCAVLDGLLAQTQIIAKYAIEIQLYRDVLGINSSRIWEELTHALRDDVTTGFILLKNALSCNESSNGNDIPEAGKQLVRSLRLNFQTMQQFISVFLCKLHRGFVTLSNAIRPVTTIVKKPCAPGVSREATRASKPPETEYREDRILH
jgi:hypothetical protein